MTRNLYTIRGYRTFKDFEIGDEARHIIDVSKKEWAYRVAKRVLKGFLIVIVDDMNFNRVVFTNNKLFTQLLNYGWKKFPIEDTPLLMGIDPRLDGYIADKLKE